MEWMTPQIQALAYTAMAIGLLHTVLGPDHYFPFIALSRARRWSLGRTLAVTAFCGVGHVLGSVLIGLAGLAVGAALGEVVHLESLRGTLAGWAMLSFGLVYAAWGFRQAWRKRVHQHVHVHEGGLLHRHPHSHHGEHSHPHDAPGARFAPWAMFVVFVLGPCEALIPILMYPAAAHNYLGLAWVVALFGLATILAMTVLVWLGVSGLARLGTRKWERYSHAVAGVAICLCGAAMVSGL